MHTDTWVLPKEVYSARLMGACVCGAVQWSYDAPLTSMFHCHCSVCRKHHGTLFATYVAGPLATFHWREGTEKIAHLASLARTRHAASARSAVRRCRAWSTTAQRVFMPAGALEGELGIRPQMHLFVGSKAAGPRDRRRFAAARGVSAGVGRHGAADAPRQTRAGVRQRLLRLRPACASRWMGGRSACITAIAGVAAVRAAVAHATNVHLQDRGAAIHRRRGTCVSDFNLPGAQFFGNVVLQHLRRRAAAALAGARRGGGSRSASLDSDPEIHPLAHQFVASKAPWYDIHDGVPQFAEAPRTLKGDIPNFLANRECPHFTAALKPPPDTRARPEAACSASNPSAP